MSVFRKESKEEKEREKEFAQQRACEHTERKNSGEHSVMENIM